MAAAQLIVDEMMQREEDESEDDYGEDEVVNDGLDTAALRHLCVMDASPLDESALQEAATTADGGDAMEKSLHRAASAAMEKMVGVLWRLPIERTSQGPVATLPPQRGTGILPREKVIPEPKAETRWEKFAREKGIDNKQKRGKMVWDDVEQKWAPRFGYKRAYDDGEHPIMEVKAGDDPFEDPWQKKKQEKKERVAKNEKQRERNTERAQRRLGAITAGLPVDLQSSEAALQAPGMGKKDKKQRQREGGGAGADADAAAAGTKKAQKGKEGVNAALALAQHSTASMGKFDVRRVGEKDQKLPQGSLGTSGGKRAKQSGGGSGGGGIMANDMTAAGMGKEKDRNSSIASKVLAAADRGGSASKPSAKGSRGERIEERKRRREFHPLDDSPYENMGGGEAGDYKKKKGRAAAGKSKKMTKKRIK